MGGSAHHVSMYMHNASVHAPGGRWGARMGSVSGLPGSERLAIQAAPFLTLFVCVLLCV
jgi:hypothetical protein